MLRSDRDEPMNDQLEVLMARSSLNRPAVQALSSRVSAERASMIQRRAGVITGAERDAIFDAGGAAVTADIRYPMRRTMTTAAGVITDPAGTTQDRARQLSSPRGMSHASEDLEPAVRAAAQGDRVALGRVLEVVRPLVVRYCRARVGGNERGSMSADDVAQEVCLAVMTALPRYQDQGRPFMAFVYGIASHKVADAHRNASRNKADAMAEVPDVVTDDHGPEQRVLEYEASRELRALLETLPEKHQEILRLRLIVGLSAEETAAATGSTAGAVRVAQHRALTKLKAQVAKAEECHK